MVATPTALTDACIMDAANWARDQIDGAQIYAWDDLLFAAVFLLTRRSFPVTVIKDLGEALEEVAERHSELRAQTLTCSAFVHRAFQLGGDLCSLQVLLPQPPIDVAMIDGGEPARIDAFWDADEAMKAYYLETATLWSIIEAQEELDLLESMNGSRVSTSQLAAAAKIVFQVAKAYGQGAGDDDPSSLPGRWVSPTDLWRCPQLGDRALLVVDRS
ncbi:MAG: hypothetical protein GY939_03995 [Actinomycetia bacterium]|nr:hypothetical protein [Actinomycetes bacterium]